MEVYDELEKALKKIERQEEKIIRLNIKNLELNNIIKEINNAFNDNNIHNNMELVKRIKNILKGIDLTEKDKRQIKGLKEEFKIGDKE